MRRRWGRGGRWRRRRERRRRGEEGEQLNRPRIMIYTYLFCVSFYEIMMREREVIFD